MITIKSAVSKEDINFCSKAVLTFRPNLDPDTLAEKTRNMMNEGFQLAYIANDENTEAAAIAGFRIFEMYRTGKIIYIDDLFTFEQYRGRGYAGALLDYIDMIAKKENILTVHLDSAYHLHPAHRLYLNKGYVLPCLHFAKTIPIK
jgi:GNAT superfamily N-acetyltransferase